MMVMMMTPPRSEGKGCGVVYVGHVAVQSDGEGSHHRDSRNVVRCRGGLANVVRTASRQGQGRAGGGPLVWGGPARV